MDQDLLSLAQSVKDGVYRSQIKEHASGEHLNRLERVERLWTEFELPLPLERRTTTFGRPPKAGLVEVFLRWRVRNSHGKLGEKMNTLTILKELLYLRCVFQIRFGFDLGPADRKKLRQVRRSSTTMMTLAKSLQFITKELPNLEKASEQSRPKPVAGIAVVEEMVTFMWRYDEYRYAHPRLQIQIGLFLIMLGDYGLRPGEVIESTSHRFSNEGQTYGDVELSINWQDGEWTYQISRHLRYRKNYRGKDRAQ